MMPRAQVRVPAVAALTEPLSFWEINHNSLPKTSTSQLICTHKTKSSGLCQKTAENISQTS